MGRSKVHAGRAGEPGGSPRKEVRHELVRAPPDDRRPRRRRNRGPALLGVEFWYRVGCLGAVADPPAEFAHAYGLGLDVAPLRGVPEDRPGSSRGPYALLLKWVESLRSSRWDQRGPSGRLFSMLLKWAESLKNGKGGSGGSAPDRP